jgi:hypothetical protein
MFIQTEQGVGLRGSRSGARFVLGLETSSLKLDVALTVKEAVSLKQAICASLKKMKEAVLPQEPPQAV